MTHRKRDIIFIIECSNRPGDRTTGNQFLNKNHASTPTFRRESFDIKSKIHFLEIGMERHGKAANPGIQKQKSNHANKSSTLPIIQFGCHGDKRPKRRWIDL